MYENARVNGFEDFFPNGFPLAPPVIRPEELSGTGFVGDSRLFPSTATYIRLESARGMPHTRLSLFAEGGGTLAADRSVQVTIVRMF